MTKSSPASPSDSALPPRNPSAASSSSAHVSTPSLPVYPSPQIVVDEEQLESFRFDSEAFAQDSTLDPEGESDTELRLAGRTPFACLSLLTSASLTTPPVVQSLIHPSFKPRPKTSRPKPGSRMMVELQSTSRRPICLIFRQTIISSQKSPSLTSRSSRRVSMAGEKIRSQSSTFCSSSLAPGVRRACHFQLSIHLTDVWLMMFS